MFRSIVVLAGLVVATLGACASADDPQPVRSLRGFADEGTFLYYVNEEYVGRSHSRWKEDGSFANEASVTVAGRTLTLSTTIFVDGDGHWRTIAMETGRGPLEIRREGSSAKITVAGKENPVALQPGSFLMEDMSPALMSQAVLAYDHEKGGKQEFPLFFLPTVATKGTLEQVETFERFVAGRTRTFRKYVYDMPPVYSVHLVVDEENRVCRAEYPAQHGIFVRKGYELLGARDEGDPLLSRPVHEVVEERGVAVPMRDGVALATDIYRPKGDGKFPTILVRTPYKKEMVEWQARFFARRGYAFAVQDVRGRFASPGVWRPFVHEGDDGYDAIEWLAGRPWSNGKVGTMGGSYLAMVQWWAASRRPPHLVTMISSISPPETFHNFPQENGLFMLATGLWWLRVIEKEATADITGAEIEASLDLVESEALRQLPVIDLDEKVLGKKNAAWREWLAHPDFDDYHRSLAYLDALRGLDLPVFHQSGWFDGNGIGSKLNYLGMIERGHRNQKLVLGPWGHTDTASRYISKEIDFGPAAVVDLQESYLRWMDRWLKGIDNGIDREPSVSLFVMGSNEWRHGDTYPLEGTTLTPFYLASEGDAGGFDGKGRLTTEAPAETGTTPDHFTYDPADPTPIDPRGRNDLAVYRTAPMKAPLSIAGPLSAVLYASSSAKDTDWIARLAKIDRQGNPLILGCGVVRARYRESTSKPKLLEPGEVCEYRLDLWQTALTIGEGEALVLVVSSALFPAFSRNLNTGENNETGTEFVKASQTIHHDRGRPSRILLPVIPARAPAKE